MLTSRDSQALNEHITRGDDCSNCADDCDLVAELEGKLAQVERERDWLADTFAGRLRYHKIFDPVWTGKSKEEMVAAILNAAHEATKDGGE